MFEYTSKRQKLAPGPSRSTESLAPDSDGNSLIPSRVAPQQVACAAGASVYVTIVEPEAEDIVSSRHPIISRYKVKVTAVLSVSRRHYPETLIW